MAHIEVHQAEDIATSSLLAIALSLILREQKPIDNNSAVTSPSQLAE